MLYKTSHPYIIMTYIICALNEIYIYISITIPSIYVRRYECFFPSLSLSLRIVVYFVSQLRFCASIFHLIKSGNEVSFYTR